MSQPPGNSPQAGEPQGTPAPQAPPAAPAPDRPAPGAPPGEARGSEPAGQPLPAGPTADPPPWQPPTGAPDQAHGPYQPGQPHPGPYQPGTPDQDRWYPAGHPGYAAPPPPRRRGLLITSIVLSVALVLCGAGGTAAYFVIKKVGGSGKASPTAAVEGFLGAVFTDHDVEAANRFVCSESRNKAALSKKINDLRSYEQKYRTPRYTWPAPTVDSKRSDTATLTVPVTITTEDDRVVTKKLRFITVNESGWWVCEVSDAR